MKILFEYNIFYISILSSFFILLLLIVRELFGRNIHRIFFSFAWTVMILRLILPLGAAVPIKMTGKLRNIYEILDRMPFTGMIWIWGTGACIAASVFVVRYIICGRILREALPVQKVPNIEEDMFTFMGIKVYVSDRIASPVTYGIFHQKVLLPKYYMNLSRDQLKFILIHEKIHIDNHDNLKKFLVIFAACLHWFNPFAWMMYVCCNRDIELGCDEKVIRQTGEDSREEYANVLIGIAEMNVMGRSAYSGFTGSAMKERLVMIMRYRRARAGNYVMCALGALAAMLSFAVPVSVEKSAEKMAEEKYSAVDVVRVVEEDSLGTKADAIVKTSEGVELCVRIFINKEMACTSDGEFSAVLPKGRKKKAGIDAGYRGTVTIPEAVNYRGKQYPVKCIDSYTFYRCSGVREIKIPDIVREIKAKAFYGCSSIEVLRMPASLEVVEQNPFMECSSLRAFEMPEDATGQYRVRKGILYTDYGRFLKVFPQGKKQDKVVVDPDVSQIATCAFYGARVRQVELPEKLIRVKSRGFQNCSKLKKVKIHENTVVSSDAFLGAEQAGLIRYK
mgnify:CR=1 FL=1